MQNPEYISERGSSWRDIAAMWLVAAFVLGLVGLSGSLFGYRSQHVVMAETPVITSVAEVNFGREQYGDDQVYRVRAEVPVPLNVR